MSKILFTAAALLATTTAPMAHAATFNWDVVFNGGDGTGVTSAISNYITTPSEANYADIVSTAEAFSAASSLTSGNYSPESRYALGGTGGIHLSDGATFTATGFSSSDEDGGLLLFPNGYSGVGVFTAAEGSSYSFTGNYTSKAPSGDGGAIANEGGTLFISNATFSQNRAEYGGGAIFNASSSSLTDTVTVVSNALFSQNRAEIFNENAYIGGSDYNEPFTAGGAIFNVLGALILTDASFIANTVIDPYISSLDPNGAAGGAIYNLAGRIDLRVTAGNKSVFYNNTVVSTTDAGDTWVPTRSSIAGNYGTELNITTLGSGTLYMFDPMYIAQGTVVKDGAGTWKLAGTNDLTATATFTVAENGGTLHLYGSNESEGAITTTDGSGAVVGAQGAGAIEAGVLQNVVSFTLNSGARLVFGGTGSAIESSAVTLADDAVVEFAIVTVSDHGVIKSNNLVIEGGALVLDLSAAFIASADVGTALTLFAAAGSLTPKLPSGVFDSISDLQDRFDWEMDSVNGQIKIVGVHPAIPEP
ncbi:MAG: hypothetical protein LBV28_00625, partial [Puniceicoccales bacterium]|nr:hypothetical protein [Puniceicoccales bacterium]